MQSRPDLRKHNHDSSYAQINHKHDDPSPNGKRSVYTAPTRQIISGAGLTGGGDLTADRTLAVGAGTGLAVNADDVALDTAHARNVDHSGVVLTAGDGLTGGGDISLSRTFDVVGGTGILVNADNIELTAAAIASLALADTAVQPARQIISGDGLTGGGDLSADRTLAVGAGTGITVNANDVALNAASIASLALADSALQPADVPELDFGTYTPTLTAVLNTAATVAESCQFTRIGNLVTVSGRCFIDPTAATTATRIRISLPIASDIATSTNALGLGLDSLAPGAGETNAWLVSGDAANDAALLTCTSIAGTISRPLVFNFTYTIL